MHDVLRLRQPLRCLEWGGGHSTLRFPDLLPAEATWTSIEHDRTWSESLRTRVTRPGVEVRFVPPDDAAFQGDGDSQSFSSYLESARRGAPYDFILIDGRARASCVALAKELLSPDGIVALHDANRSDYLAPTAGFRHQVLLQDRRARRGTRVAGGVWLGSDGCDLERLLPLNLHRRLFSFYSGIGRLLA